MRVEQRGPSWVHAHLLPSFLCPSKCECSEQMGICLPDWWAAAFLGSCSFFPAQLNFTVKYPSARGKGQGIRGMSDFPGSLSCEQIPKLCLLISHFLFFPPSLVNPQSLWKLRFSLNKLSTLTNYLLGRGQASFNSGTPIKIIFVIILLYLFIKAEKNRN